MTDIVEVWFDSGSTHSYVLDKRKDLWLLLQNEGYEFDLELFLDPEYNKLFDRILYEEIGYPSLTITTVNLFYSPYGITSLREYFANGFEAYFYHRDEYLSKVSPILYQKIEELEQNDQN